MFCIIYDKKLKFLLCLQTLVTPQWRCHLFVYKITNSSRVRDGFIAVSVYDKDSCRPCSAASCLYAISSSYFYTLFLLWTANSCVRSRKENRIVCRILWACLYTHCWLSGVGTSVFSSTVTATKKSSPLLQPYGGNSLLLRNNKFATLAFCFAESRAQAKHGSKRRNFS